MRRVILGARLLVWLGVCGVCSELYHAGALPWWSAFLVSVAVGVLAVDRG